MNGLLWLKALLPTRVAVNILGNIASTVLMALWSVYVCAGERLVVTKVCMCVCSVQFILFCALGNFMIKRIVFHISWKTQSRLTVNYCCRLVEFHQTQSTLYDFITDFNFMFCDFRPSPFSGRVKLKVKLLLFYSWTDTEWECTRRSGYITLGLRYTRRVIPPLTSPVDATYWVGMTGWVYQEFRC